jgi:predicted nucleic acid-binding protein
VAPVTEGKRGTAALEEFLAKVAVHDTPTRAEEVASMEGIAVADASVILLAEDDEKILLANDKGLIAVARSHGVECWWVTTLLLSATKEVL